MISCWWQHAGKLLRSWHTQYYCVTLFCYVCHHLAMTGTVFLPVGDSKSYGMVLRPMVRVRFFALT